MSTTFKNEVAIDAANAAYVSLTKLNVKREKWDNGINKRAQLELYRLLSGCLSEISKLREIGPKAIKAFNTKFDEEGFVSNKATSLELKVSRIVFGINKSQRANHYARVLKIAYAEGIKASDLVSWIEKQNGIEQVRRNSSKKDKPNYQEIAEQHFEVSKGVSLSTFEGVKDSENGFTLALVRQTKEGKFIIVSEIANASLVTSALDTLGKTVSEKEKEQFAQKLTNDKQALAVANSKIPAKKKQSQKNAA